MADTWSENARKRKFYQIGALVLVVLVVAFVFVKNNTNVFDSFRLNTPQNKTPEHSNLPEESPIPEPDTTTDIDPVFSIEADTIPSIEIVTPAETNKNPVRVLDLPRIRCKLAGKDNFEVDISLRLLYMPDSSFEQELLLKREDLKTMTRRVLARHTLSGIVAKSLTLELKDELDAYLESGKLAGVAFTHFSPIP